jgi:uncharacterized protein GlcG (DUF336 family)
MRWAATPLLIAAVMQAAFGQAPGGQGAGSPGGQSSPPVAPGVVRTDVVTLRALTMQYSMEAAQAALAACASTNPHVAVVVVDTAGNPRLILVADGAKSSLVDHATRKGFTAAALRQVTSVEQKMVAANPQMVVPPQGQNLIEPGGVPIRAGTQVIGGIGVEGGNPMEAEKCAQAGVDTLKDDLHPEIPAANGPRAGAQPAGAPR